MKLRKPVASHFKPAVYNKSNSIGCWDFDPSCKLTTDSGKLTELTGAISRPSGKGRFGKRTLSFTIDYGGHSNDSNSNDSGVGCDFHSSESQSQLSWCSEDSHLGRSSSISNISAASVQQFPNSCRKKQFLTNLLLDSLDEEAAMGSNDDDSMTGCERRGTMDLAHVYSHITGSEKASDHKYTSLQSNSCDAADENLVQKLLKESKSMIRYCSTPVTIIDEDSSADSRLVNGIGNKPREQLKGRTMEDNENQEHKTCVSDSPSNFVPRNDVHHDGKADGNFLEDKRPSEASKCFVQVGVDVDPLVILSQAVSLQKELCDESTNDKSTVNIGLDSRPGVTSLFDTNSAKLLLPEKAQLVSENMRMSPDTTDSTPQYLCTQGSAGNQIMAPIGSHSPNSGSPTSTVSPVPTKRARFSYPTQLPSSGIKGTGLKLRNQNQNGRHVGKRIPLGATPTLTSALAHTSRDGRSQLQIVAQPEEQHRARYQTEGSRGAIKDRKGNGFPTVKLTGYDRPATLQIFIGTDQGKVSPHMFYQACKVTGKSSTPCIEKKIEGTVIIEIEFEPSKDMVISCDCVGILKERNVDVEQRFPFHHASQSRKKSTKCRMIFRTTIVNAAGIEETLQISSVPILCTQPPGLPEICKQSLYSCPVKGGLELFVIGKNFLKDTKLSFQEEDKDGRVLWESTSEPLKDYLQQNHLICQVPPYKDQNVINPVECRVVISSGGKQSEPHRFEYLPNTPAVHYGIPASTCIAKSLQRHGSLPASLTGSLSHDQQQMMSLDLQVVGQMASRNESEIVMIGNAVSSPQEAPASALQSNVGDSNLCQQPPVGTTGLHQQLGVSSPPLDPLPPLPFSNNIIPPRSAQERQVVNELQSILEQSEQQNQHDKAVADMYTAASMLSIKPESTYTHANMNQNTICSSVPVDLQFPAEPVQPLRQPVTFAEQNIGNTNPHFTPVSDLGCMNQQGVPQQMLNRSRSMELSVDQKMLTELMPNSQVTPAAATIALGGPISAIQSVSTGHSDTMITTGGLSTQDCIGQGMIKTEPQQTNVNSNMINTVVVSSQPCQPTTVIGMNPGNYIGGEMLPHQGNIAAISQMSDNELLNYINPSCFEQNLI